MKSLTIYLLPLIIIFSLGSSRIALGQNPEEKKYKVLVNHEEEYSIWLSNEKSPEGWKDTRISGNLKSCHDYIEEVWTDMRPLSIRKINLPNDTAYRVVINHEEQYSIWPADREIPKGWKATKTKGKLTKCQDYIEEVWTDMRPLSLRKRI